MALPSPSQVATTDFSLAGQPAVYLEAKALDSGTLDYSLAGQPVASTNTQAVASIALAATEAPDTANAVLALSDTIALAATESPDTVALVVDAAQSSIDLDLAATESPDTLAGDISLSDEVVLAATEAPDTMSAVVTVYTDASLDLAATEAPDTVLMAVQYGNAQPDTHDGVGGPIRRVKDRWKWRSRQEEVREALTRVSDDDQAVGTAYEAIEAVVRNEPQAMDLLADFARRDQELYDQTLAIMAGVLSIKVAEQRQIAIQLAEAARQAAEEDDLDVLLLAA